MEAKAKYDRSVRAGKQLGALRCRRLDIGSLLVALRKSRARSTSRVESLRSAEGVSQKRSLHNRCDDDRQVKSIPAQQRLLSSTHTIHTHLIGVIPDRHFLTPYEKYRKIRVVFLFPLILLYSSLLLLLLFNNFDWATSFFFFSLSSEASSLRHQFENKSRQTSRGCLPHSYPRTGTLCK